MGVGENEGAGVEKKKGVVGEEFEGAGGEVEDHGGSMG